MTFWCGSGSGSADPRLWLTDADADLDPAIFVIDLQDANKKLIEKEVTIRRNQGFSYYFCLMTEGSGSGSIPLTSGSGPGCPETCGSGFGSGFGTLAQTIQGTVSQDFLLLVFFMNQFPPSPRVSHYNRFEFFSKIRGDIHKSRCTTGINDTGGKFVTGV